MLVNRKEVAKPFQAQGYGAGNWSAAYQKAKALVARMTLVEMNNLTIGYTGDGSNGCVGISGSAPRVGFPGFCLQDAGNGVRGVDGVNAYASGVHAGASFNPDLAYTRGQFLGAEFKRKGVNVALGPVVQPIGRTVENGRNFEGFGADPYLQGVLGAQTVRGMQESVITSVKHYIAYEQETNRNPTTEQSSTSADIDDQTIHELYLWPFQDLIYAGAACVMCSYNRINNTYACENSKTMNGLLKGELNFQGFVVSDWGGQHSGIPSANGGLDMAMPTSPFWNNNQLANSVTNGTLNDTRLTDMATRIVASWYQIGEDAPDYPTLGVGIPTNLDAPHNFVNARDPASQPNLLQQATEGHVLVKNTGVLPIQKPAVLSLFGYDAYAPSTNPPSLNPISPPIESYVNTFLEQYSQTANIGQDILSNFTTNLPIPNYPETVLGTLIVGGGSGANTPAYISAPYDAIQDRAYQDGTEIFWDFSSYNPSVVGSSDACLVFLNEYSTEGRDRWSLADPSSDQLVQGVASQCNNTMVIIHNVGIRTVDAWINNPNVTAVVFAHLPGQDSGRSLVQVLYGDVSPSGRLPYTVAKQSSDYGDLLGPCVDNSTSPQCYFTEGVNIDYRSFLARNITPRYEFGYGLTYTNFSYGGLGINVVAANSSSASNNTAIGVGVAGQLDLFDSVGLVTAVITNTGKVAAAEVAQLYLQSPQGNGPRTLRGFQKIMISPGASEQVSFNLRRKDISYWDIMQQKWLVPAGQFQVFVGRSVLDTPLTGMFQSVS